MTTPQSYFESHPKMRDGVMKAFHAYHVQHFRLFPTAHNFTSTDRQSTCLWCGRTRELVRWDDLPAECQNRPAIKPIDDTIIAEEEKAFALLEKAKEIVPKELAKSGMNGLTLSILHHTHGFDPSIVELFATIQSHAMDEYNEAMGEEKKRSREAIRKTIITAK